MFRCRTNEDVDNERRLDYNEILEHLGPFGLWQKVGTYLQQSECDLGVIQ